MLSLDESGYKYLAYKMPKTRNWEDFLKLFNHLWWFSGFLLMD